jgi:hypothetical protein
MAAIFVNGSGRNEQSLYRTFHRCFLPSFESFGQVVSEEKIFRNRSIRNKNCLWGPCLSMDRDEMSTIYRGPPIDASYQVLVHFAKRVQGRRFLKISNICMSHLSFNSDFFRNQPIRNKNCLWRPCLLTDRDKMSNLYRGPSIDVSYQVSVHLQTWLPQLTLKSSICSSSA